MAITVTHSKVSTIPDGDDSSLIRPSDWNDDHVLTGTIPVENGGTGASTLTGYVKGNGTSAMTAASTIPNTDVTGLGTMSTQNANNVAITGGSISGATVSGYIPTSEKAQPLGVATLDAGGKVPTSQIPLQGDLNYQGTWNATTNSPTLASGTGTKGYYYVVDVAGTTNLDGITDWQVGDWAIFNGTVWQKVDNTDAVTSVNGLTGTVVLTTTNIAEGTNEYFTTARARASVSAGTAISYDNSTGVITNSAPDQTVVLTAGTGISTSGTYPNFTITNTSPSLGGDVVGPSSATDNAIARFDTTTGKLIQNSTITVTDNGDLTNVNSVDFDITPGTLPTAQGTLFWDNADSIQTLSLVMEGGNAIQQIGEETYFRIKCSSAITEGQVIMFTGTVGSSGGLTGAPATGLTASTASYIMGVATESGALNDWIYVTNFGLVRGIDTTGGAEAWVDGQILYYNPSVTGGLTKTLPSAPNAKVQVCAVVHADANGSLFIRPSFGGVLGQYEGDVQVTTPADGQLLIRNQTDGKWVNTTLTDGTGISITEGAGSVTVTNTAPDQTVVLTAGTGISTSGTYPNFTITNTSPSSGGTVTSVDTGTGLTGGPITSTGTISLANTAVTPATYTNANITVDAQGRITSASNGTSSSGTVTSVAATVPSFLSVSGSPITTSGTLALTYSGTALPVANGGTSQSTYTTGDILYASASNTLSKLTVGSTGQVLNVTGGVPSWTPNLVVASNIVDTSANTGSLNIPQGTTAQRPGTPAAGAFRYNSTTAEIEVYLGTWQTIAFSPYSVSFLVIGGGGGGGYGSNAGGGGGAGGYRNSVAGESSGGGASAESNISVIPQTSYTVTIGAGGAGAATTSVAGTSGNSSVFSTITSVGGGGGGSGTGSTPTGVSGGCGGGGGTIGNSTTYAGGSGTTNQGYAGGSGRHVPGSYEGAGGGGGAASVGANSSSGTGGVGGTALSSSINGSSVARAGGGGGGGNTPSAGGGGGAGAGTGVSATANTGSGGGGNAGVGGAGGSGIVIIRYSGAQRGTGGTVTSSGGYTIHTFTSSGTYIA